MLHNISMSFQVKKNLGVTVARDGVTFRVWAPFAKKVSIIGSLAPEGLLEMESENDGYWSLKVSGAEPGQNYRFQIDTGEYHINKNDPRARILTSSENGVSVIPSNDFDWGDDFFMPIPHEKQIIYELHIGTFNRKDPATQGTFYDAIEKLDYLVDLGINVIEVMPVTSMTSSNGWGYSVADIFSIESAYGGRHGLMSFVKACHERGIGVIVDVVYNHFFSGTLWQFDGWSENDRGGIYFYNDWRGDTPWGARPDYGRPEVRQFILDNVVMWMSEYRLDGIRLDSTIYMRNTEGHNNDPAHDIGDAWHLMGDITNLIHKINPGAIVIAEDCAANEYITKSTHDGGCGFDAQWELGFPHALRDALGLTYGLAPNLAAIRYELTREYNGNAFEKVIFSDSHDTAANGSVRISEAAAPSNTDSIWARRKTLLADAVTLTAPGIPMLLQGNEFMQEGSFNDWQTLEWDKAESHKGIVLAHKQLIDLRLNRYENTAGLMGQSINVFHQDDMNHVLGYHRWSYGGPGDDVYVLVNFSGDDLKDYRITLPIGGEWKVRFNSSWKGYSQDFNEMTLDGVVTDGDNVATLNFPPLGVYILSQEKPN